MHNHRLVPEGAAIAYATFTRGQFEYSSGNPMYHADDTIPMPSEWAAEELVVLAGITPEQWAEICCGCDDPFAFSQYLSDLISLAPLKGLSKEQIEELANGR